MIPPAEEKVFVFLDIFCILFSYYSLLGTSDFWRLDVWHKFLEER